MKKASRIVLSTIVTCIAIQMSQPACAESIGNLVRNRQPIKVFVRDFSNESGQNQVVLSEFKKEIEKAFTNRKSVSFQVVKTPGDSDVEVSGIVKQYQYLHRGPFKITPGIGTLVADAVATATSNYVDMVVSFAVLDARTGQELWGDTITSYVKRVMTPSESIPLVYDKIARAFVSRSFGKGQ